MIAKRYVEIATILLLVFFACAVVSAESKNKHTSAEYCKLVPKEWLPSLDQVVDTLNGSGSEAPPLTQQAMNLNAQNLADVRDAQLYIAYVRLAQKLDRKNKKKLYKDQQAWLRKRNAEAETAVVSKGGSLAPLEYSSAYLKITEKRLDELNKRWLPTVSDNQVVKNK